MTGVDPSTMSKDFQDFVDAYFNDAWAAMRGDEDREPLRRLVGKERAEAERLILENINEGGQFVRAAGEFTLEAAVTRLQAIVSHEGAVRLDALFSLLRIHPERWEWAAPVLDAIYHASEWDRERLHSGAMLLLPPSLGGQMTKRFLADSDHFTRWSAYDALVEAENAIRTIEGPITSAGLRIVRATIRPLRATPAYRAQAAEAIGPAAFSNPEFWPKSLQALEARVDRAANELVLRRYSPGGNMPNPSPE